MISRALKTAIALLATALLAACATSPEQLDATPGQWQLQGKIGIWYGDQQESASIDWQHCGPQRGRIRLSGPLGTGALEIVQHAQGVTLKQGGEVRRAATAEQLAQQSGWPIPVSALSYWARGQAAPGHAQQSQISPVGQLLALRQQNWNVSFRYADGEQLPERIEANAPAQKVVLLVREWNNRAPYCQTP